LPELLKIGKVQVFDSEHLQDFKIDVHSPSKVIGMQLISRYKRSKTKPKKTEDASEYNSEIDYAQPFTTKRKVFVQYTPYSNRTQAIIGSVMK
jgi:hypothetical protein